ncbi:MAG: hypothetical protein J7K13_03780 [Thermoplasmata archaeon]|nr:hypothetical protein [Thermoplasmata archaeon]
MCIIQACWYRIIILTVVGTAFFVACSYKLPGALSDFSIIVCPKTSTPSSTVIFFVLIDTDESVSSPQGYIASKGQIVPLSFTGKLKKAGILAGKEVYIVDTCTIFETKKTKNVVIHGE